MVSFRAGGQQKVCDTNQTEHWLMCPLVVQVLHTERRLPTTQISQPQTHKHQQQPKVKKKTLDDICFSASFSPSADSETRKSNHPTSFKVLFKAPQKPEQQHHTSNTAAAPQHAGQVDCGSHV